MDGARNLLLSTCKERNLRVPDLNVDDENHTFMSSRLEQQGYKNEDPVYKWEDNDNNLDWIGLPDESPHRQYTVLRFGNSGSGEFTYPSWLSMSDNRIFNLSDSNELYVRIKTHWDGTSSRPSGEMSVLTLDSPTVGNHFNFSFVIDPTISDGRNAKLKLTWTDRNGVPGSYTSLTNMFSNNQLEIKLFFYVDHIYFEAVQSGVYQGPTITETIPFGGLPRNKGAKATLGRNGLDNSNQYRGYVSRIGFGRNIDSRPPIPKLSA